MNILSMCARIKFEFGATIFEVNDDVITLFVYKVLHDLDLKLDFNIEIKPTVRRFKISIWRDKPTVLEIPRCLFIKHILIIQIMASNHSLQ